MCGGASFYNKEEMLKMKIEEIFFLENSCTFQKIHLSLHRLKFTCAVRFSRR